MPQQEPFPFDKYNVHEQLALYDVQFSDFPFQLRITRRNTDDTHNDEILFEIDPEYSIFSKYFS